MHKLIAFLFLAACTTTESTPVLDAAPIACTSTVVLTCGPRPLRPDPQTERWGHDIELWAQCAEDAAPAPQ